MFDCQKSMKMLWGVVALLMIVSCNWVSAEKEKKETKPAVTVETAQAEGNEKLVKVCTLNSAEANQEFQRNVQVMQAQRKRIIQLQTQLEQTQTPEMKKSLQKEIDTGLEKLNTDNKKMAKTYGFSLNNNYVMVVEQASVYMVAPVAQREIIQTNKKKIKK